MQHFTINPHTTAHPTRDFPASSSLPTGITPKEVKTRGPADDGTNASVFFVGTASVVMYVSSLGGFRWVGVMLMGMGIQRVGGDSDFDGCM